MRREEREAFERAEVALLDAIAKSARRDEARWARDFAEAYDLLHRGIFCHGDDAEPEQSVVVDERDPDGRVLAWVNEVRAAHDLPTLAALPEDCLDPIAYASLHERCPIAQALNGTAGITDGRCKDDDCVVFPDFVTAFIKAHDKRRHSIQGC